MKATLKRTRPGFAVLLACGGLAMADTLDNEVVLRQMLDAFLADADKVEAHDAFWADELVYTSSSGDRTDKPSILASMSAVATSPEQSPTYSAEDVDIRVYGGTAVLAFRLVADSGEAGTSEYFNTGTLLMRDGRWQVVAWQATRIPDDFVEPPDRQD